eukprot:796022-Pelagomonas_calceolata.AAC.2
MHRVMELLTIIVVVNAAVSRAGHTPPELFGPPYITTRQNCNKWEARRLVVIHVPSDTHDEWDTLACAAELLWAVLEGEQLPTMQHIQACSTSRHMGAWPANAPVSVGKDKR